MVLFLAHDLQLLFEKRQGDGKQHGFSLPKSKRRCPYDSITGTFLMNEILGPKDRVRIEEGSIFTLGATTLILRGVEEETE